MKKVVLILSNGLALVGLFAFNCGSEVCKVQKKKCNWAGDLTLVNTTTDTLEVYTETHDAMDMPTTETDVNSSIANNENYSMLILVPGDSLTIKMPCGAIKYEALQKKSVNAAHIKRKIGWVRSVGYDVRVEIREEELE